ncbi:recombinase family protein [Actinomadura sp. NPDC023710]|uniref:recombinase family protein n=1 Tax=Actinomadura sp. NPDC023710 TaxID=3158219 RepID=UPI00340D2F44
MDGGSGAEASRPKLDLVGQLLREGDTLKVTRLDRLPLRPAPGDPRCRAARAEYRAARHRAAPDTATMEGQAMFGMLPVLAEPQRELIVANGLASARDRGRVGGRVGADASPSSPGTWPRSPNVSATNGKRASNRSPTCSACRGRRCTGTSTRPRPCSARRPSALVSHPTSCTAASLSNWVSGRSHYPPPSLHDRAPNAREGPETSHASAPRPKRSATSTTNSAVATPARPPPPTSPTA